VIGVIPKALNIKGVVYDCCDELIVTEGMRERKAVMDARSKVRQTGGEKFVYVTNDPNQALEYIDNYQPVVFKKNG